MIYGWEILVTEKSGHSETINVVANTEDAAHYAATVSYCFAKRTEDTPLPVSALQHLTVRNVTAFVPVLHA